ncbi:MAG: HAMP domain-containing histidine kinase [Veillonella sp.]|nr:HAMP domain-containing histidine kinase [Veillonella sp.]
MNLQIRIWISNVVLFVVPILIAIILFLLYFTGLRILANAGYYLRIEQEQQFKSVSRITETITFYGLENNLIDSLVKPSYSLLDPKEVYVEVLDQGNMVYSYGNPQIYSASAIVGLIDVNPELQGIVYQSNNTFVYEMRKYDGRHAYVYHIAIKRATHGSDSLMESVSFYIIIVAILLFEMEQEQQKELLAGISHDIRTPLTAIKAYAEGVRDGIAPTEEQQKRYMGIILKRANDLDSMLEELFLITTLNYKKESRPSERIELGQYVRDFVEDHLAPYQTRGLEIKFRIAAENAKYKMADVGHCVIDVTSDDDFVYCVISDDGPGVPPESLERLMRPFYRVDSSRTNPQEGSGLGLSIIRRIMEIFEGRVVIENVRPHGLRIILEFPKQGEES